MAHLKTLSYALICGLSHAAPITWSTPEDTINPESIVTTGTVIEAVNGTAASGNVTVNGVDFTPSDTLLPNAATPVGLNGGTTLDPGLDALLDPVEFGGGSSTTITVGNDSLIIGQSYTIQIFFTDLRGVRVMTYGDNEGNTVDVAAVGAPGTFGQFVTGIFTADAANQTISLQTNGFGNAHINAYQVRTEISIPLIESFTATPSLIASGESSTLTWQINGADSAQIDNGIGTIDVTSGEIVINPTTTTTYTLTAVNGGGTVTSDITVGVDLPVLPPILNEFLASNSSDFLDQDGNSSDWIEIYNPNPFAIDLDGYHLTSDSSILTEWTFPAGTTLNGDSHLIIFASGNARGLPELHTNFRIPASGGYLALIDPDGFTVITEFNPYPEQRTDISLSTEGILIPPTPGAPNGNAFSGFVSDTTFDQDRGFYDAPFSVTIATDTPEATIIYTTDGTDPSLTNGTSTPAPALVPISQTTTLRAAAFKEGLIPTNIDTHTYLFTSDIIEQANMDPDVVDDPAYSPEIADSLKSIRTLSIVTDPDFFFDTSIGILENTQGRGIAWERPVSIEFIDPVNPSESIQTDAGIRVHGNGSRGSAKNSLRLLFRSDYGPTELEYPLFGEDFVAQRFNTVVLRAQNANSWTHSRSEDRRSTTYLQDSFAKDTQGVMNHPTAGSTFVHLYLNGIYWGLYNPTERPDGAFGESHFGGDDSDYDAVSRRFDVEIQSGTREHWDAMIEHSNTGLDTQEEYETLIEDFIDIENLIDYMLVHQFMQTRDGPDDFGHNNMRLVRSNNPAGLWQAYAWDMEYSMIDTTGTRDYVYPFPIYSSTRINNVDITDSIASVYIRAKNNNPEFQLHYADRAYKHLFNNGVLSPTQATDRFQERADEIESAVVGESARWGDHRRTEPYTRDVEWFAERNRIVDEFFPARPDHVISQLRTIGLYPSIDPPVFSQHGGEAPVGFTLSATADSGTIYFTTDGSDPREAWTDNAIGTAYTAPIELNLSTTVKARTLVDGEWSALAEADFLIGTLADSTNLVISEIFYNPSGSSEDLEFIEIQNISSNAIELSGVQFTEGIEFTFAANTRLTSGQRALLVRNTAAFEAEYGIGLPIIGEFQNSTGLSNSGERITLLASDGSAIRDFEYSDDLPWPNIADGDGPSLVLANPTANPDHGDPASWRISTNSGGNPSTSDAIPNLGGDLLTYALVEGSPQFELELTEQGLNVSFIHILAADEVSINLEWSTDLDIWTPAEEAFEITNFTLLEGGLQQVNYTSTAPSIAEEPKLFIRLSVE